MEWILSLQKFWKYDLLALPIIFMLSHKDDDLQISYHNVSFICDLYHLYFLILFMQMHI